MPYPDRPGWKAKGASVHDFLRDRFPAAFSADQIADGLGETILSVRPGVSELKKMRAIEAVSQRHKNQSGMSAHCWRAVVRSGG
jgi:hypothetical protein